MHPHQEPKVIQDFPKAHDYFTYEHLTDLCTKGLENCLELRRCTWTRDGSLTSHTLRSLGKCPKLTEISINGRHWDIYEPEDLLHLLHLHKISLIEPTMPIIKILPSWIQATAKSLTSLALTWVASESSMRSSNALFIHKLGQYTYHRHCFEVCVIAPFTA